MGELSGGFGQWTPRRRLRPADVSRRRHGLVRRIASGPSAPGRASSVVLSILHAARPKTDPARSGNCRRQFPQFNGGTGNEHTGSRDLAMSPPIPLIHRTSNHERRRGRCRQVRAAPKTRNGTSKKPTRNTPGPLRLPNGGRSHENALQGPSRPGHVFVPSSCDPMLIGRFDHFGSEVLRRPH